MELTKIKPVLEPVAWALVAAHGLLQVGLVISLFDGIGFGLVDGIVWLPAVLVLVIGLLVGWAGAGSQARPVAIAGLVVIATGAVVLLTTGVMSFVLAQRNLSLLGSIGHLLLLLSALVVPVVAFVLLVQLLPQPEGVSPVDPPALPAVPEPEPLQAPVWQPDRAAGAHWQTAGAAASGAAAHDWGRPGERSGWGPDPGAQPGAGMALQPPAAGAPSRPAPPGWPDLDPDVTQVAPQPRRSRRPDLPVYPGGSAYAADPGAPGVPGAPGSSATTGSGGAIDFGPPSIARRYADGPGDEDNSRSAPLASRRQPPKWTPLEDPTQPPPA